MIFRDRRHSGRFDFEAVETATRAAMHRAGAAVLSQLLSSPEAAPPEAPCARGQHARYHDRRPKQLLTALGAVGFQRAKQLELPEVCSLPAPVLYIEMDGAGVPVAPAETAGRAGKTPGRLAPAR